MRNILLFCMTAALALAAPARGQESWPQRQVTIVVPFAAGGSADLLARILQQHMQARFNVPFVVENRAGAGGSIGAGYVAKAPNDGYTLLLGTLSTNVLNPLLNTKLPFDAERDFQPLSLLVHLPNLLVVSNKIAARTVPELIAHLKANEGKVNYGSSGNGTSSHLSAVMFQLASGTKMTHVPFRSTSDELQQHDRRPRRSRHRQHDHAVAAGAGWSGPGDRHDQPPNACRARPICRPSARRCPASR